MAILDPLFSILDLANARLAVRQRRQHVGEMGAADPVDNQAFSRSLDNSALVNFCRRILPHDPLQEMGMRCGLLMSS